MYQVLLLLLVSKKLEQKYHAFGVLLLASEEPVSFRACSRDTEHKEHLGKKVLEK